jgi:o-succinylbenzoate synthase
MRADIWFHKYVLRSGAALNSASTRLEFPGALLRVGNGFTAVHPWPEFGDLPLEQQLSTLAQGGSTPLLERALACAEEDAAAREAGVSLFAGLEVPQSHYSWSFGRDTAVQVDYLRDRGFRAIKVKGFHNYGETTRFLDAMTKIDRELRFRVDFNGCLEAAAFRKFIEFMPLRVYRQLDLIEDGMPYDAGVWSEVRDRWDVRLALDKGWQSGTVGFDVVVVKPARRDWRQVRQRHPQRRLMLTSAMDHPLGQAWAAYEAALAKDALGDDLELCGLVTQHLFQRDAFSECLGVSDGVLQVDRAGTGLGFDQVLETLDWQRLT